MLTAHSESLTVSALDEMKPHLSRHYDELSVHKSHGVALNPDFDWYLRQSEQGGIVYVTLRSEGALVGYFVGLISRHPHYRTLECKMDLLYVVPEHRGSRGGLVLGQAVEAELKRRGVQTWWMGFKEEHREHMEKLLQFLGMKKAETYYMKWLGD